MHKYNMLKKSLVCVILVLFIGIAIIPSIHAEVSKTNFVQKKTDNIPPVADAGGPYNGKVGEVIILDGSDSYDPDGIVVEWYWFYIIKIGGHSTLPTSIGYGETIEYSWDFEASSIYVYLRVKDNDGAIDYDKTNVIIENLVSSQQLSISSQSSKSVIPSTGKIDAATSRNIIIYNGSLSGYVNDTSMYPIEGALVRVYFHGTYEEDYSDSTGYYHVTDIPICYCLKNCTASKEGYSTEWVLLGITENTTYDFVLTPIDPPCYPVIDGTMGENGWYVSCVSIDFVINPELVAEVYYSIDDGEETLYTEPFEVCEDGFHELLWRAVDHEGNWSDPAVIYFRIDQTPPEIDLTWEATGNNLQGWQVIFTATCNDVTSGIDSRVYFCINDVLQYTDDAEPFEWIIDWSDSLKLVTFKATVFDNAGNSAFDTVNGSEIKSYPHSQSSSSQQSLFFFISKSYLVSHLQLCKDQFFSLRSD